MTRVMPTDDEMRDFLEGMRQLILDEAETQKQAIHEIWHKPLAARVTDGHAIEDVHLVERFDIGLLRVTCEQNNSRFREGDVVRVHRGDLFDFDAPHFTANIETDDGLELTLKPSWINWGDVERQRTGWIIDADFVDLSQMILEALKEAADTTTGRKRVLPLLMGYLEPQVSAAKYDRGLDIAETVGLNEDQGEAFAAAYATDLVHLIQGPPGTGKTFVLSQLARALVEDGERVLVTGFTHRAINNALNKIHQADPELDAVKIGTSNRARDLVSGIGRYEAFEESSLRDLDGGYIVGATPFALRTSRLSQVEFDTIIFDEASQITLPLAVMGMLAGQKYIFFGDHYQLPPVLTTAMTGGAFRSSVFERLVDGAIDSLLTETYRLNADLAEWPNDHFYDGELLAVKPDQQITYPQRPARHWEVLNPAESLIFWDIPLRNTTTRNWKEANAIVSLIETLVDAGFSAEEIGVVVPYRAQGRLIRNQVQNYVSKTVRQQLIIDTVERMQGQERDLIIVSLTTSEPSFAARLADFFFQPERINVAVTRPRSKLIIVGSSHVLNAEPTWPRQQEAVALLRDLIRRCTRIIYPYG